MMEKHWSLLARTLKLQINRIWSIQLSRLTSVFQTGKQVLQGPGGEPATARHWMWVGVTCCAVREGIETKKLFWKRTASVGSTGVALFSVKSVQSARNWASVTKFLPGEQPRNILSCWCSQSQITWLLCLGTGSLNPEHWLSCYRTSIVHSPDWIPDYCFISWRIYIMRCSRTWFISRGFIKCEPFCWWV